MHIATVYVHMRAIKAAPSLLHEGIQQHSHKCVVCYKTFVYECKQVEVERFVL